MANQTYALVNLFRRLTYTANDALDTFPTTNDQYEPGQQNGIGNVALGRISFNNTRERARIDLCHIEGERFRQNLNDMNAVVLDIYDSNGFYMCDRIEMETGIRAHINQTDAYAFIAELNHGHPMCVRQQLDNDVAHVTTLLNDLLARQCITESQFYQMTVDRSMVRMDYGYFLPDLRRVRSISSSSSFEIHLFL
jgi:hypothetical protein